MLTLPGLTPEVEPQQVGLDPERLARLDRYLDNYVAAGRQKGSLIAIHRRGKLAHVSMRGYRDEAAALPVQADTIWRFYSMSKPITSVAAMMLYEEGKLGLFDPVARFIPSFEKARVYRSGPAAAAVSAPAANAMQVWHLMTHTSGLTYDFFFQHPVDEMYRKAGLSGFGQLSLPEACDGWASIPLLFEPGTAWNYSVSTDVLGRVVEVASGMSLDEFFAKRIFEPLGMRDTSFFVPAEKASRFTRLYAPDPQTGQVVPAPNVTLPGTEAPKMLSGGGGLVSTAGDYLRFTQLLLGRGELDGVRLLAPHTVDLMARNHLPGGALMTPPFGRPVLAGVAYEGRGFGLGFSVLVDPAASKSLSSKGEYAWGGAAGTQFWVDPAEELTVVFCTQVLFAGDDFGYHLRQQVYQAVVD